MEKELEQDLKKHEEKVKSNSYKGLVEQIKSEHSIAENYMKPRWSEHVVRLKLYNNQRRDKEAVGDPLLFSVHQTLLAALYDDRLAVTFKGREKGDEETAENLNILAEFDQADMEKDVLDYVWDWDTTFFGAGLCLFQEFDIDAKSPIPEIIDPLSFMRDPRATSVRGDRRGRGAMRFCGREIRLAKWQMKKAGVYENIIPLNEIKITNSTSTIFENQKARAYAQGYSDLDVALKGENADVPLIEWWTVYGDKFVFVTLTADLKKVIRIEDVNGEYIPIIDRRVYPIAHDFDGCSIPDFVEDKQRARATVQNLALHGVKANQYGMYLYNSNIIKNKAEIAKFEFNKFVGVSGDPRGQIVEVPRGQVKQEVEYILSVLDRGAQQATATPELQQGVQSADKRTATELNLQASKVDTRYSLSAKIFGWSEKRFWREWYHLYKEHFADGIAEKVVTLAGSMGDEWRPLTRSNIIAKREDPDIKIESSILSEAKRMNDYNLFTNVYTAILKENPGLNRRYADKYAAKLSGLKRDDINMLLPITFDEWEAGEENKKLDKNIPAKVTANQDHVTHIQVHARANDTHATRVHLQMHRIVMFIQREKPELMASKGNPNATNVEGQITPSGTAIEGNSGNPAPQIKDNTSIRLP